MITGTVLVLLFSDPMVDVLSKTGDVIGIPAFYVSFVLAPIASNASELVSSYNYALRKTQKSITTSLATLEGAACMNNTFCLAIFFALVYWKGLAWQFTAETIVIVLVELIVGAIALTSSRRSLLLTGVGIFIGCLYPVALAGVYVLENFFGLD